jgi:hypothetical protein
MKLEASREVTDDFMKNSPGIYTKLQGERQTALQGEMHIEMVTQ